MPNRILLALFLAAAIPAATSALEPLPEKLVVLTFDDSVKSHFTVVRPILLQHGFGATFFVTEGWDFATNKRDYMTWDEIAQLHRDGFEIGNHTRDHLGINDANVARLSEQLRGIDEQCEKHGIPKPVSFAWPGNALSMKALPLLREHGIQFARRGGAPEFPYEQGRGVAYEPQLDHPLLIPSAGDGRPDWQLEDFIRAVTQTRFDRCAVVQFHGVPDTAHGWVNTEPAKFAAYMNYLAAHGYRVIALRDLAKYVDPAIVPSNPQGPIEDRKQLLAAGKPLVEAPRNNDSVEWLENMLAHGFSKAELAAALAVSPADVEERIKKLAPRDRDDRKTEELLILPYPGTRHPRIGFRDGALRPQRETKISVFAPWRDGGYVVVDLPEAIWVDQPERPALLYLAHTHVPTLWDKAGVRLPPLEWRKLEDKSLEVTRTLPNQVQFTARAAARDGAVRMELSLTNGTAETLRGLRVQNCVMLKGATGFAARTNDNKRLEKPFVACRNEAGDRWIITAWSHCQRAWANPPCPCLHADPQFPDCEPGQTQHLVGWLWFYPGRDIDAEIQRLKSASGI